MSLTAKKILQAPSSKAEELVHVVYDFANDGGAQGDYDVLENGSSDEMIVELDRIEVETAGAGATSVLDLGKGEGGTEFLSDKAVASFSTDAILLSDTANTMVSLASGEKIVMGIETADLTAGKYHFIFKMKKRSY